MEDSIWSTVSYIPLAVTHTQRLRIYSLFAHTPAVTMYRYEARDTLDVLVERQAQHAKQTGEDPDQYWGLQSSDKKTDTGAVDNVERALRSKLEVFSGYRHNPLSTLSKVFVDFDANHSGKMSEDEFVIAIATKLNFGGFKNELRALFKRYDLDSSGELTNEEFVSALFSKSDDASRLVGKIREVLSLRAGGFSSLKAMGRQFNIIDKDKNKRLSYVECEKGLNMLCRAFNIRISHSEAIRLFQEFDDNMDGAVSYDEFVRTIRGGMNPRRNHLVRLAFDTFEKDKWGRVTLRSIASAYDVSQHPDVISGRKSSTEALYEFMKKWDKDGDQSVSEAEFIEYYEWISANIENDDYFELMIRNAWHISGGQGWTGNTSCRRVLVEHTDGQQEIVELKNDIGIGTDTDKIKQRLRQQGVLNIKFVKLSG